MASTLQITDGTTTVNLLNSTGLYLKENGWKAAVAQEDENGDYQDMIEVITCTWMETTDDDRAETLKTLKRLDRKAREHWRKRLVDGWVWLAASTHSETDTRYAIIKSIDVKELDPRHWQANQPSEITLVIKHVLWWGIAPNGTPTTVVSAQTIWNKSDSDGDNWVTVAAADVDGDAPAIAIITVDPDGFNHSSHLTIARKRGSTTDLNVFNPWLNAVDELDRTSAADTAAPADTRINFTADSTARWAIAAADIPEFEGDYLVYLVGRNSSDLSTPNAQLVPQGFLNTTSTYDAVSMIGGNYSSGFGDLAGWFYLGKLTIPFRQFVPSKTYASGHEVKLYIDHQGHTVYGYALALVPIDDAVFAVRSTEESNLDGSSNNLVIDGRYETVYLVNGSGNITGYTIVSPLGKFLTMEPGQNNRLYFFRYGGYNPGGGWWGEYLAPNRSAAITVQIIPRYTSLRGND